MKDRSGFALVTVLWIVAALAMLVTAGLADADVSRVALENRLLLREATWAGRGCLAILRAHALEGIDAVDSTDLGRGAWCRARRLDPSERVNPNLVDSLALKRVLGDERLVDPLLDWLDGDDDVRPLGAEREWYRVRRRRSPRNGPIVDPDEIALVRGFEGVSADQLDALFTARGDGRVDPNRAPPQALRRLIGVNAAAADRIARFRASGEHLDDPEEVANAAGLRLDADAFRELTRELVFEPLRHVFRIESGVTRADHSVRSRMTVTLGENPDVWIVERIEVGR